MIQTLIPSKMHFKISTTLYFALIGTLFYSLIGKTNLDNTSLDYAAAIEISFTRHDSKNISIRSLKFGVWVDMGVALSLSFCGHGLQHIGQ